MTAAEILRERARSYSSDALKLKAEGDEPMCAAYRAIASELRSVALVLESTEAPS